MRLGWCRCVRACFTMSRWRFVLFKGPRKGDTLWGEVTHCQVYLQALKNLPAQPLLPTQFLKGYLIKLLLHQSI